MSSHRPLAYKYDLILSDQETLTRIATSPTTTDVDRKCICCILTICRAWQVSGGRANVPLNQSVVNRIYAVDLTEEDLVTIHAPMSFMMPTSSEVESFYFWYGTRIALNEYLDDSLKPITQSMYLDAETPAVITFFSDDEEGDEYISSGIDDLKASLTDKSSLLRHPAPVFAFKFMKALKLGYIEEIDPGVLKVEGVPNRARIYGIS